MDQPPHTGITPNVTIATSEGTGTIRFTGPLIRKHWADGLEEDPLPYFSLTSIQSAVMDLSNITTLFEGDLVLLVTALQVTARAGTQLFLYGLNPDLKRTMQHTGMKTHLTIIYSQEELAERTAGCR